MAKKAADLSQFQVKKPDVPPQTPATSPARPDGERVQKGFRIRTEAARELGLLKLDTGRSEQDLVAEALNLLFEKHGRPPVA